MFSELINTIQGMNNMVLTVLFACIGVIYFTIVKPALSNAQELQKLQTQKMHEIPTEKDIAKLINDAVATIQVGHIDKKLDSVLAAVVTVNQDLVNHAEEEVSTNDQQSELLENLFATSANVEALLEHLIVELGKNSFIPAINNEELDAIKLSAMNAKNNLSQMLSFIDRQLKLSQQSKKHTKLSRVMNTRG